MKKYKEIMDNTKQNPDEVNKLHKRIDEILNKKSDDDFVSIEQNSDTNISHDINTSANNRRILRSVQAASVAVVLLIVTFASAYGLFSSYNEEKNVYKVENGYIPKTIRFRDCSRIRFDTLEEFEKYYFSKESFDEFIVVKAKKISSTSYYKEEYVTEIFDPDGANPYEFKHDISVGYTLSNIVVTNIVYNYENKSQIINGDKLTIVEHYFYRPNKGNKDEFIVNIGYYMPIMENGKEYLIFLRTTENHNVDYGMFKKVNLQNTWLTYDVFLLDDQVFEKIKNNELKNGDIYYGDEPRLYKTIFEKYLNIVINTNEEQKATSSPTENSKITPVPEITRVPEITPVP